MVWELHFHLVEELGETMGTFTEIIPEQTRRLVAVVLCLGIIFSPQFVAAEGTPSSGYTQSPPVEMAKGACRRFLAKVGHGVARPIVSTWRFGRWVLGKPPEPMYYNTSLRVFWAWYRTKSPKTIVQAYLNALETARFPDSERQKSREANVKAFSKTPNLVSRLTDEKIKGYITTKAEQAWSQALARFEKEPNEFIRQATVAPKAFPEQDAQKVAIEFFGANVDQLKRVTSAEVEALVNVADAILSETCTLDSYMRRVNYDVLREQTDDPALKRAGGARDLAATLWAHNKHRAAWVGSGIATVAAMILSKPFMDGLLSGAKTKSQQLGKNIGNSLIWDKVQSKIDLQGVKEGLAREGMQLRNRLNDLAQTAEQGLTDPVEQLSKEQLIDAEYKDIKSQIKTLWEKLAALPDTSGLSGEIKFRELRNSLSLTLITTNGIKAAIAKDQKLLDGGKDSEGKDLSMEATEAITKQLKNQKKQLAWAIIQMEAALDSNPAFQGEGRQAVTKFIAETDYAGLIVLAGSRTEVIKLARSAFENELGRKELILPADLSRVTVKLPGE